ncbi:MAG TPA: iron-sulfur cluster assembly protein [Opitutaceae bacterium]
MNAFSLQRDVAATLIPAGDRVTLKASTPVDIVQTLGGNVTVRTDHGLFRIDAADTSAIAGYTPVTAAGAASAGPEAFSEAAVWSALKTCFDPEIPVNIVDLGLVYDLAIEPTPSGKNRVEVKMTLTAQGCGMGPVIADDARRKIAALPDVEEAKVHIVWDPVWAPQMISAEGRKVLGLE